LLLYSTKFIFQIYDGFDDTARQLYEGCETTSLPDALESTNNVVYIKLNNRPIRYGSIFRLEWLKVQRNTARQIVIPTLSTSKKKKSFLFKLFLSAS
jgi:hypothetical protein